MLIISLQLYVNLNRFIYICCLKGTLHDIYVSAFEIAQIKSSYLTEVHDVNNAASSSCVHSALTLISRDCLDIKCQIVRCNQRLIGRMKYSNILVDPYPVSIKRNWDYLYLFFIFYYHAQIVSKLIEIYQWRKGVCIGICYQI